MMVPGSHETCPTDESDDASWSSMEEVISKIIFDSCLPRRFKDDCFEFSKELLITCGSSAEFYINPIESCIGDDDQLSYSPGEIAFSGDVPLLPFDVRNCNEKIVCNRLKSYKKYPGFVRIKYIGEMKYKWNLKIYEFYEACKTEQQFIMIDRQSNKDNMSNEADKRDLQIKGPAISYVRRGINEDHVFSIYCPQWPTEAKDWFHRPRNFGWPTKANLHNVANIGCHVVYVQHRDCRDDERQWRLSFSSAEVVLLRSWTKTQQLVYHMLRIVAKEELIQKNCPKEEEVLCTYHFKTLMLWTCEQESPEWWKSSVIGLCSKLLHKLLQWLQRRHCPNYFIPEANLFHEQFHLDTYQTTVDCLQSLCNCEILSQWFLDNYLLPYITERRWMDHMACDGGFIDLSKIAIDITLAKEIEALNSFETDFCCEAIGYSVHFHRWEIFQEAEEYTDEFKYHSLISTRLPMKSEISTICTISLTLMLRAASTIMCKRVRCNKTHLSDNITLLLRLFTSYWPRCNNFPFNYETRFDKSYVQFLRAQEYLENMPKSVNEPEFQLLSTLTMEFLINSVTSDDAMSQSIRCAAFAYMAAICYVSSQYQSAVELCSEILTNPQPFDSSRLSSRKREPLSAGCLIFIDDVSNIIGYLLLCKYILDRLLDRYSEINLDLRLSPEVFAQYIKMQSMQKMSQQLNGNWNQIPGEFLMDALLAAVMKRNLRDIRYKAPCFLQDNKLCVYRRSRSVNELLNHVTDFTLTEDNSIRLLMECSLNKMTSLYEDAFEGFCYPFSTLAFCYRVVYHYRYRHYDQVIVLSEQILREPDIGIENSEHPFLNVMVLLPFSSYYDDDMQCLIGLQTLCLVLFHKSEDKLCYHDMEIHCDVYCIFMKCDSLRCLFLLGRHFLARYLHLRCLIDTNSSLSEVITAFGKLKCRLSFEYIVRMFLWQKLKKDCLTL